MTCESPPISDAELVILVGMMLIPVQMAPGREPADLTEDLAWVRAASGRAPHPDPRLPLLG